MNNDSKQVVIKKEIHIPEGFQGVCLKGHTVLYISGKTELPEEFNPGRDFIRELLPGESGGGMTNTGAAIINCDTAGQPHTGLRSGKMANMAQQGHYLSGVQVTTFQSM